MKIESKCDQNCLECTLPIAECPEHQVTLLGRVRNQLCNKNHNFYVPLDVDKVVKARRDGLTQQETAISLGLERHTLSRKFQWRWSKKHLPDAGEIRYLRLVKKWTQAQICEYFDIDHKTLKAHNLWPYKQFRGNNNQKEEKGKL